MWHIRTQDSRQMEKFLHSFAKHLLKNNGRADIDLVIVSPDYAAEAQDALTLLKTRALARFSARNKLTRRISATDPLMGYDVDLNDAGERAAFAKLAHRVIHAEAWEDEHQLLCWVESDTSIYLDMDVEELRRIISAAEVSGSTIEFEAAATGKESQ